ncbi:MAG: InlB B-repeat-containing protein [Treponema sp.]|nr:InlB B-repeat-containing protein [Treponema sp.]
MKVMCAHKSNALLRMAFSFVALLSLFSCELFNTIEDSDEISQKSFGNGTAFLSLSVKENLESRTALPSVSDINDFTSFKLAGTGVDENSNPLSLSEETFTSSGGKSAYATMNEARIPIQKGKWSFTLIAIKGGASYGGSISDIDIAEGTNSLAFTLSLTSFDTTSGTGDISVTLSYPAEYVAHVTAGLYTTGGVLVSGYTDESVSADGTAVFEKSGVSSGQYIIVFKFFAENDVPLYVFREYAQVAKDLVSISKRMIENMESPYSITYNMNSGTLAGGATAPATYSRRSGDITLPILVRTGYLFGGWYTDSHFADSAKITTIASGSTGNYVLYAKWIPITYTIKFDANANDGTTGTLSGTTADLLATYDKTDALTTNGYSRNGYAFVKWNSKEDGTGRDFLNAASAVWNLSSEQGGEVTLYAQWKVADARYTVRHFLQNIYDDSYTEDESAAQNEGGVTDEETAVAAKTTYTGFTPQAVTQQIVKSDDSTVVNVYYDRNSYTLSFEPNATLLSGAADTSVSSIPASETRKYQSEKAISEAIPTRTGYVFASWNTQSNGGGTRYAAGSSLTMAEAGDTTLYAEWTANQYTVKFDGNGGTTTSGEAETIQVMRYDHAAILSENTFRLTGYAFDGWAQYADGTGSSWQNHAEVVNLTAENGGTVTLFAKWKEAETTYTVEHYKQNASGSGYTIVTADTETKGGKTGEDTAAVARTYEGFTVQTFAQKKIENNGSTLVKIYYDRSAYTLSFDKTAGSGTMASQTFYNGILQALNANQFTRTGYSFDGWATESSGVSVYLDGADYAIGAANATLYASWKANNYTVTLSAAGATTAGTGSVTVAFDSALSAIPTLPRREGYSFAGYFAEANGMGSQYYSAAGESMRSWDIPANTTLYAHWVESNDTTYTVKHFWQNTTGNSNTDYTLHETESRSGTTGQSTAATAKSYTGFNTPTVTQATIAADGSAVVEIRYERKTFTVTYTAGSGITSGVSGIPAAQTFRYGQSVTVATATPARSGYTFNGWTLGSDTASIYHAGDTVSNGIAANLTLTANWTKAGAISIGIQNADLVSASKSTNGKTVTLTLEGASALYDTATLIDGTQATSKTGVSINGNQLVCDTTTWVAGTYEVTLFGVVNGIPQDAKASITVE